MKNIIISLLIILAVGCQKQNLDQVQEVVVPTTTTPPVGPTCTGVCVTDIDGNVYHTIQIGTQTWMMENLRVTKYRDGSLIPNTTSITPWSNITTGTWCYYNDNSQNNADYGKLYNWYAVNDSRGLAPANWHIPTYTEWTTLENYLGGNNLAGGKLKETGTSHWNSPNTGATNSCSFSALPGGLKQSSGGCSYQKDFGFWWSTFDIGNNNAYAFQLDKSNGYSDKSYQAPKVIGLSVRCIKDYTTSSTTCSNPTPGMIKTIAGLANTGAANTTPGSSCSFPPDGINATQVVICPSGPIAVDLSGNVFYAEGARIRKIDNQGILSTVAGNGGPGFSGDGGQATAASISIPQCIAFDNNGNLVFSDYVNCRIRRVNMSTGIITTIVGNGVDAYAGNNVNALSASISQYITGICFDAANNLYFSDQISKVVRQVNSSTNIISLFAGTPGSSGSSGDGGLATLAKLNNPAGLAFYSGKIYIGSADGIRCVTSGIISSFLNQVGIYHIHATQSGNLYYPTPDAKLYTMSLITPSTAVQLAGTGIAGDSGDCGPALSAKIAPGGPCVYNQSLNAILFTDPSFRKIRMIKL
ncbi:MAG: hypothetical protein IPI93_09195 [Sphingobacteriaceae bacterium]|nr:hypothetical protein [Sphingobacteriaceae bacterium]